MLACFILCQQINMMLSWRRRRNFWLEDKLLPIRGEWYRIIKTQLMTHTKTFGVCGASGSYMCIKGQISLRLLHEIHVPSCIFNFSCSWDVHVLNHSLMVIKIDCVLYIYIGFVSQHRSFHDQGCLEPFGLVLWAFELVNFIKMI